MLRSGSRDAVDVYSLPRRDGINWITTSVVVLFHIGAVAALFNFSWPRFWAAVFLYWVATGLGISMGYHRLHTHRGVQVPAVARILLRALRHADPRRRADFLGSDTPPSSSEFRSAGRSAFSARRRLLLGARGLADVRGEQSQQYAADVEVRARSREARVLRVS